MKIIDLGDTFASDIAETLDDVVLGRELADVIGDTFLDVTDTPSDQWSSIVKTLRVHGLKIVEIDHG